MRRLLLLLLTGLLLTALGCGGDKDKGVNKNQDRPRAADR
jgi:hypothetical protein